MTRSLVDRIADAVLYEGYILYPYRPSVKNRQRWTFGGLYPRVYSEAGGGSDAWANQTECLVRVGPDTTVTVRVRFLHLTSRSVGECDPPLEAWPEDGEPAFRPVEALRVGDRVWHSWQEAEEREVTLPELKVTDLLERLHRTDVTIPARRWLEPVCGEDGKIAGALLRVQHEVKVAVEARAVRLANDVVRLTLRVRNETPVEAGVSRDEALMRTLVSTHAILGAEQGEFISLMDPPDWCRGFATDCRNVGIWPVLVGEEGQADTVLSSPIILYDYPQIAPESPGDLFDGTEIDEILTLRILTLTDDEKREVAAVDPRAEELLARTEALAREQLMRLHGTVRGMRPPE